MERAFISHISEEKLLAERLKQALVKDFLGLLDVFVSSDRESIAAGEEWLRSVETAVRECALVLILCSPESILRPWINFEAGAAWIRGIVLIPVCHSSLSPRDLPMPLSLRQGVTLAEGEGLRHLYARVAEVLSCHVPDRNFSNLAEELCRHLEVSTPQADLSALRDHRDIRNRLSAALQPPNREWRTLYALAAEAGISDEQAADLLRSEPEVRFSRAKSGSIIVGLRARVGDTRTHLKANPKIPEKAESVESSEEAVGQIINLKIGREGFKHRIWNFSNPAYTLAE